MAVLNFSRLVVFVMTLLAVAGCSGDGSGGLPNAQLMIGNAAIAMKDVESAHVVMTVSGSVSGLSVRSLDADVSRKTNPAASRGTAVLTTGQRIEFVESGGTLYVKGPTGAYAPAPAQTLSPTKMLAPTGGLGQMLSSLQNPTTVAKEAVKGVEAFKIVGTVPQAVISGIAPAAKSDADFTVWLRVRWPHSPVRTTLQFHGNPGETATMEFTVSDVNKPVSIAPPA